MARFIVSSENGPTIRTWACSARNAKFIYSLTYRSAGNVSVVVEVE